MEPVIHGIILAFGLILPLGVQNVFLFNQGIIQKRFIHTLPAVITAGMADTIMISIAVTGISVLVWSIPWIQAVLYGVGFCFLAYIGWSLWISAPESVQSGEERFTSRKQIIFAASVSLLNPHAILDIVGVIGTSSLAYSGMEKWSYTIACIVVSWVWFLGLAAAGRFIGQLDAQGKVLVVLNRISALLIWIMAIFMLIRLSNFL
ncbi:L-lysine exporter family protein LysE/ArgO [Terribacillus saccharophilus]|uniref:L-lysine exporter family protein LysE/ArgO n=1 Tax=Terribacillus saccharophilus TaxID=361277 RepID=A0AAX2EGS3_9BACI|nr:LysE family transporter [Terribacillus saccharophilus]MCM3225634.1 LysE family transporter [Terribacillus saccharophilus]SEN45798.1 L-lysine exporter family protein LysE/ArgO [Terribacillus saccharophilus]